MQPIPSGILNPLISRLHSSEGEENSHRILGLEPPNELREKLKLAPNEILKLLKGAYGRVDASIFGIWT